jgi:internalin A
MGSLQHLDISFNELAGIAAGTFQHLINLVHLNLSHNHLQQIPEDVSDAKSLKVLDLSSNDLTQLPPSLSQMPELRHLNLNFNRFAAVPEVAVAIGKTCKVVFLAVSQKQ